MIRPSGKLKKLVELYDTRADFCRRMNLDEAMLSKLLTEERGASSSHIEKVLRYTGWKFEDAWEIVEGDGEAD